MDMHADGLFRFVVKNMGNEEDSRDVVQDVFAKLWEKIDTVQYEKVKSYLFTSAYRTMLDKLKKMKPDSVETTSYIEPNHEGQYSDTKEIIDEALQKLNEKQRAAIMLRDYEGYSYDEIGNILDMNESQVKVTIFRARKALKNYLKRIDLLI